MISENWKLLPVDIVSCLLIDLADGALVSGLKVIEEEAFAGLPAIDGVILPDGVTNIGNSAFQECNRLYGTLTIGSRVTTIGDAAFAFHSFHMDIFSYFGKSGGIRIYGFISKFSQTGILMAIVRFYLGN